MDSAITPVPVTESDLLRALQEALRRPDNPEGALTTAMLVKRLGWGERRVYQALDQLGDAVECVYIEMPNRTGSASKRPAYRLRVKSEEGV